MKVVVIGGGPAGMIAAITARKKGDEVIDEIVNLCEQGDKWLKGQEVIDLGFADRIIEHKK